MTPENRLPVRVRPARREDGGRILALERELARFENLAGPDDQEGSCLLSWIFDENRLHALVAEREGEIDGVALYFFFPTSFRARLALYLEDIVIAPNARSGGVGTALMGALAIEASTRKCVRMEWAVLPWNEGAIRFYLRLGARRQTEWERYSLGESEIEALAAGANL